MKSWSSLKGKKKKKALINLKANELLWKAVMLSTTDLWAETSAWFLMTDLSLTLE